MLTIRRAILVALVVTAFWAVIFVLTSDASAPYEICKYTKEGAEQAAKECSGYKIISFLLIEIGTHSDILGALITAIATTFIARYTFTLKRSTDNLWKAGDDQLQFAKQTADRQASEIQDQISIARDGATAAKKSADAAVAVDRARLYVVIEHNFLDCIKAAATWENTPSIDETPIAASNLPMAKFRFRNYGKTPAILAEVSAGIAFSEGIPDPVFNEEIVRDNIIPYDQTSEQYAAVIIGSQMTLGEAKKVRSGEGHIWIFGRADYDDVFGERQTHRFFQRLVGVGPNRFRFILQSYDYKHYNKST